MKKVTKEFLVGCLVIVVVALMVVFGWLMGVVGPFADEVRYSLLFSFAGGVEVGSPVRVAGVKVGKVEKIEFVEPGSIPDHADIALKIRVGVSKQAARSVREDSKFFVNMAGIIGERYVEVSPGSAASQILADGATVRAVDPPRIDQLLSQGYGVFGRIQDFLEQNEQTISDFLAQTNKLMTDFNRGAGGKGTSQLFSLISNMNAISLDVRDLTRRMKEAKSQEFFDRIQDLVKRAHEVDKPTLKKFLQEEGIRARIF